MKRSEGIVAIAKALLAAQKKIGAAKKEAVNPFFRSNYADLGSVMEACKDALNEEGISVLQPIGSDIDGVYVETVLLHESGEWISDRMRISVKAENDPQAQGSAITYARRYGLQSMVFIPAEDDDGEKATKHPVAKPQPEKPKEPASDTQEAETKVCMAHGDEPVAMQRSQSKSTGKWYWGHRNAEGQICFGTGYN